jgi:RecB family exonuclease
MTIPGKRTRNIYNPKSEDPFKLSRSKIELFTECPRCFYLDRRLGVGRPPGFPFTLNSAVDTLLKKEFDVHRARGSRHPLMETYGVDAVPFQHDMMDEWRENFKGVQFFHRPTNLIITGAVDDLWVNKKGEVIVVDYKATSTDAEITLDADYRASYKRQMEIYQWLMRKNGFAVSDTGYFVYANGNKDKAAFDAKLEFSVQLLSYKGNDSWVEDALFEIKKCLDGASIPNAGSRCEYCPYRDAARSYEV